MNMASNMREVREVYIQNFIPVFVIAQYIRESIKQILFLFLHVNACCGYSLEAPL